MDEPTLISEDDFEEQWEPTHYEVLQDIPAGTDVHHVWTIVEGDSGDLYASAGYHLVNRISYVVTARPWVTGDELAEWHIYDDERYDD